MHARIAETGFVTPGPVRAQRPDEPYQLRFLDGLAAPVQYFVIGLDGSDVIVISSEPDNRLRALFADHLVVFVHESKPGRARITASDKSAGDRAAAATAAMKAIGGWDETTPIVIDVGGKELAVTMEFVELQWQARVESR